MPSVRLPLHIPRVPTVEVNISEDLLVKLIEEVLSDVNRYYAWQKHGESVSLEMLVRHYSRSCAASRLFVRNRHLIDPKLVGW